MFGSFIAFPSAVSAVVFQQTYVQEVRRHTEDFLKSEKMTAFSSVFPCMYVQECLYLVRRIMAFPLCVCVCMGALVQDLKSATSLLGSGCMALKIVYLTVIATFPCWPHLQDLLPTLILLSISSECHIDNFLRCFLRVFCELFKQYCVLPVL